jgi:hypothetical protein
MSAFTVDRATRMRELLSRFKLPTVAAEVVRRLRWTCKSTHALSAELFVRHGIRLSYKTVSSGTR